MSEASTQLKDVGVLPEPVQLEGVDHTERRRPGRQRQVSSQLLPLLRNPETSAAYTEAEDKLRPALALIVIASCSAALWFSIIRMAAWFLS